MAVKSILNMKAAGFFRTIGNHLQNFTVLLLTRLQLIRKFVCWLVNLTTEFSSNLIVSAPLLVQIRRLDPHVTSHLIVKAGSDSSGAEVRGYRSEDGVRFPAKQRHTYIFGSRNQPFTKAHSSINVMCSGELFYRIKVVGAWSSPFICWY
jgi:hypothetical protein